MKGVNSSIRMRKSWAVNGISEAYLSWRMLISDLLKRRAESNIATLKYKSIGSIQERLLTLEA